MITMSEKLDSLFKELKVASADTFFHSLRVKNLAAEMLGMTNASGLTDYTPEEVDAICKGALLHDIGKLFITNFILTKETYLTPEEKARIREHPALGLEAIRGELSRDEYEIVTDICLMHHERIDGSGYMGKTEVPMYVQIVSICDVFDALYSDRVYREGFGAKKSMELIEEGACGAFKEELISCMRQIAATLSNQ